MRYLWLLLTLSVAGCATSGNCLGIASADNKICALNRDENITSEQIKALVEQAARERAILVRYFSNNVGPITLIVRDKGIAYHKPPATI